MTSNLKVYDGRLPKIFRMLCSGASGSGKSSLLRGIIKNTYGILTQNFERLIYLRGIATTDDYKFEEQFGSNLIVFDGIPSPEELLPLLEESQNVYSLVLAEDLDTEIFESSLIFQLIKKYSHHWGFSFMATCHNFFGSGKHRLSLIRNLTHFIIFPNELDSSIIRTLAQRVHPAAPKKFVHMFDRVTSQPFGYLSVWSNCGSELRFRSDITEPVQKVITID